MLNNVKLLKSMLSGFKGNVYGDKGYISKLKKSLQAQGCKLITKIRKNMKKPLLTQKEQYCRLSARMLCSLNN